MSRSTVFLIVAGALLAQVCWADQTPFGPFVGRTSQVVNEVRQFGDKIPVLHINTRISDSAVLVSSDVTSLGGGYYESVQVVYSPNPGAGVLVSESGKIFCGPDVWGDPFCIGARQITSCTYASLSAQAKNAVNLALGSCTKSCFVFNDTLPWGETRSVYHWSCAVPAYAECVKVSGFQGQIALVESATGCQF